MAGWFARRIVARGDPFEARLNHGTGDFDVRQVAHEMIYRPSATDVARANHLRREFVPDLDYACELYNGPLLWLAR